MTVRYNDHHRCKLCAVSLDLIYHLWGVIRSGCFAVGDDSSRNASQPDKSTFNMPFESELYTTLQAEIAVGLTCLHLSEPESIGCIC